VKDIAICKTKLYLVLKSDFFLTYGKNSIICARMFLILLQVSARHNLDTKACRWLCIAKSDLHLLTVSCLVHLDSRQCEAIWHM
jgi:hypothetical protein